MEDEVCPICGKYNIKYVISTKRNIIAIYCYNCDTICLKSIKEGK